MILDLASKSRRDIADDINQMIQNSPETINLLRTIKEYSPSEKQIKYMKDFIMSENTKTIIIAAGLGSRLENYTLQKPKCLLKFGGKSLLQHQIDAYSDAGITKIVLVRGYKKECIK